MTATIATVTLTPLEQIQHDAEVLLNSDRVYRYTEQIILRAAADGTIARMAREDMRAEITRLQLALDEAQAQNAPQGTLQAQGVV